MQQLISLLLLLVHPISLQLGYILLVLESLKLLHQLLFLLLRLLQLLRQVFKFLIRVASLTDIIATISWDSIWYYWEFFSNWTALQLLLLLIWRSFVINNDRDRFIDFWLISLLLLWWILDLDFHFILKYLFSFYCVPRLIYKVNLLLQRRVGFIVRIITE